MTKHCFRIKLKQFSHYNLIFMIYYYCLYLNRYNWLATKLSPPISQQPNQILAKSKQNQINIFVFLYLLYYDFLFLFQHFLFFFFGLASDKKKYELSTMIVTFNLRNGHYIEVFEELVDHHRHVLQMNLVIVYLRLPQNRYGQKKKLQNSNCNVTHCCKCCHSQTKTTQIRIWFFVHLIN